MTDYRLIQKHIERARVQRSVYFGEIIASGLMTVIETLCSTKGKITLGAAILVLASGFALTSAFDKASVSSAPKFPAFATR